MAEPLITADDLVRGGCCFDGVYESANENWPAAFTIASALLEARKRDQVGAVREALKLDGYGNGYGYGGGSGYGGYGDGDGYGGYGDGSGDGYGYGGYGDGDGDGSGGGSGYGYGYGGYLA